MNSSIESSGLEDVTAATTRLSDVDGAAGCLVIAGFPVEDIAGKISFEDVLFLLFYGRVPSAQERGRVQDSLFEAREAAFDRRTHLGDALAMSDPMDALRTALAHLSLASQDAFAEAIRIIGAAAVFAAAWTRRDAPVRPDRHHSHAGDYLRMVRGEEATIDEVAALDAYFVTVVDHGMNASTFAARVVASTGSDTTSAIIAALGALKGPLHGGAPGPVLDMLDAINGDDPRAWILNALARGERIMGMGHRVYRVRDPRALVLERAVTRLQASSSEGSSPIEQRLLLARAVETAAEKELAKLHPQRALKANVEFYTAILLEALRLPRALFTATFAVSRAAGWCAHIEEQRRFGRLIRPKSRYVHAAPTGLPSGGAPGASTREPHR